MSDTYWLIFSDDHLDGIVLSTKEVISYLKRPRGYITKIQLDIELDKYQLQQLVSSVPKLSTDKLVSDVNKLSTHIH